MLTIGWFSTGRDRAARQLLQAVWKHIQSGQIEGRILFVFCNREPGESNETELFFEMVRGYHIPLICLSSKKFKAQQAATETQEDRILPVWRFEYDREVMTKLQGFTPDICVLAGYMLIIGHEMCQKYAMINLHPAAPGGPTGTWQEVIWTLLENRANESGIMMHLVTPELDRGPVLTYCTFPITGTAFDRHWQEVAKRHIAELKKEQGEDNTLFRLIRQQALAMESPLIVSTLGALSRGEVRIEAGEVLNKQGQPIRGCDLTEQVKRTVGLMK